MIRFIQLDKRECQSCNSIILSCMSQEYVKETGTEE